MSKNITIDMELRNPNGTITYKYAEDEAIIDFCEDADTSSELLETKFVIDSYFESCCTLLYKVEQYRNAQNINDRKKCLLNYLPAFFCFRHYLELRLKYLYMLHTNKVFSAKHDLSILHESLRNASGLKYDVFNKPIELVESIERINNYKCSEFSRYLITKQFDFKKKIDVVIDDTMKMREMLIEIEGKLRDREMLESFSKALNYNE